MFGKMKSMMDQLKMAQQLMKDDNFKALMSHPKVQELFKNPDFISAAKSQDFSRLMADPKFAAILKDPEVLELMKKLKPPQ